MAEAQHSMATVGDDSDDDAEPEQVFKQFMCSTKYLIAAMFHDACSGLDRYKPHHHQLRWESQSLSKSTLFKLCWAGHWP